MSMPHFYRDEKFENLELTKIKELRRPLYYKSIGLLSIDWLLIITSIIVVSRYPNPLVYVLGGLVIGGRMMALWALLHDGHHHLLLRGTKMNRMVTQWFIAWPLFKSLKGYDEMHSAHHRHLGKEGDPNFGLLRYAEFTFPMSKGKLLAILLGDILGVNFIRYRILSLMKDVKRPFHSISEWTLHKWTYYGAWVGILTYFDLWVLFLMCWLVPLISYFQFAIRITLISDHCFAEREPIHRTRTVRANWFERNFIAPHNLHYHLEHHTYSGVPCYNLGRLHAELMKHEWFRDNAAVENGYLNVFRSLVKPRTAL